MPAYGPGILDILARAYERALDALPAQDTHDPETARAILLTGILDAARAGELDETALTIAGLNKLALFDAGALDGVEATAITRNAELNL